MNSFTVYQKQDIVGRSAKTKLQKCTLQIYKWAILSGEEFMVLEKLVGEKFMIPCQNIHPWKILTWIVSRATFGLSPNELLELAPFSVKPPPLTAEDFANSGWLTERLLRVVLGWPDPPAIARILSVVYLPCYKSLLVHHSYGLHYVTFILLRQWYQRR